MAETARSTPEPTTAVTQAPAWIELAVDAGPEPREDHTWTVAGETEIAYLFGGRDIDGAAFGDLWAYELATDAWHRVDAPDGPAPRFGHEAEWVEGIGLVIFAGQAGSAFFNDLWAFEPDAGTWRMLSSDGDVPVPRYGTCAALGPDGRLWVSHGFTEDQTRFADTRAYDFGSGSWSNETPDGTVPVRRCLHGCWWTDVGDLALYAGQTTGTTALDDRWIFSDGAWTRVDGALPPARNLYARARIDGGTVVFGGQGVDTGYLADLWLLADGSVDAQPLDVEGGGPSGRAGAELVHDMQRQRLLLFGGRDADAAFGEMWELTGVSG